MWRVVLISIVVLAGCACAADARPARDGALVARAAPPLPAGKTVRGAVRRAYLAGHIERRRYAAYRRLDRRSRAATSRLSGRRRAELGAVVGTLDGLAATGRLTASRMPLAFLTLRRNIDVWANRSALPRPGERLRFGRDPVVFQAFSGQGVQVHPLASFGRANALARACLHETHDACRPRALRRALDRMVTLSSHRGGARAWEHLFSFGGATVPWVSGMTQGTAVQALARGSRALRRPGYLKVADDALGIFESPPPAGVAVPAPGGRQYVMYSSVPSLRILNGFLQSVIGLHDLARISGSARARRAYRAGEGAARAAVAAYDTGAWSLYASGGRESSAGYHRLVHGFLSGLCTRTHRRVYCGAARRFGRYLTEPPRIRLAALRRTPRPRRPVALAFTLSKIARVAVRVTGPRGTTMRRTVTLSRGAHRMAWTPGRRGRYHVRIQATGLSGPRGILRRTVRVRPLPRKHKPRHTIREGRSIQRTAHAGLPAATPTAGER
jgi:hypothetical protein